MKNTKIIMLLLGVLLLVSPVLAYSGVEWDKTADTYTRLGEGTQQSDFDSLSPWKDICRVNLADNGSVLAVYGDANFAYDGSNGQVMVRIPKFYYKTVTTASGYQWNISDTQLDGYAVHPAFVNDGKEADYIYIGAFEANSYNVTTEEYHINSDANVNFNVMKGDKITSIGGIKPLTGGNATLSITYGRRLANNRGYEWGLMTFNHISAVQMLYLIEYANFNSQSTIGSGVTGVTDASGVNLALETGYTAGIGVDSADLGNASGKATVTYSGTTVYPVSYRGIENLWGNALELIDGANIKADRNPWIADYGYRGVTYAIPYEDTTVTLGAASSYITDFAINSGMDYGFLPSAASGGSSTTKVCDWYSQNTGARSIGVGGYWVDTDAAGLFSMDTSIADPYYHRKATVRAVFVPNELQQTINTNAAANTPTVMSNGYSGGMGGIKLDLPTNTVILGQGNVFTNVSMTVHANDVLVEDVVNANSSVITISEHTLPAFKLIGTCDNVTFRDCYVTDSMTNSSAFLISPTLSNAVMTDILFDSCYVNNTQHHGFNVVGYGTGNNLSVSDITFLNCTASRCGYNSRASDWVCGFQLGETDSSLYLNITDMYLEDCTAAYNWESGFYVLDRSNHIVAINTRLYNCTSNNNAVKPVPMFGSGFRVFNGTLENCRSYNEYRGFGIFNTQPGSTATLLNCHDNGSQTGFYVNHDAIAGSIYTYTAGAAVLTNCVSENATKYGLDINNTTSATVSNMTVTHPVGYGGYDNRISNVSKVTCDMNYAGNSANSGVLVSYVSQSNISGAYSNPTGQNMLHLTGAQQVVLHTLDIDSDNTYGVYATGVSSNSNITVTNSQFTGIQGIGLTGSSGIVYVDISSVKNDAATPYTVNTVSTLLPTPYEQGYNGKVVLMHPGVSFAEPTYTALAGSSTQGINIMLSQASVNNITVVVTTSDGSAIAGTNYDTVSTTVHFAPGETLKTVIIPVKHLGEGDKEFYVSAANPIAALINGGSSITVILKGDITTMATTGIWADGVAFMAVVIMVILSMVIIGLLQGKQISAANINELVIGLMIVTLIVTVGYGTLSSMRGLI